MIVSAYKLGWDPTVFWRLTMYELTACLEYEVRQARKGKDVSPDQLHAYFQSQARSQA